MSTRKTTVFYAVLIALASAAVTMVITSRLDLASVSSAQTLVVPPMNSAPLDGPVDMSTFRNIAKAQSPMVVNISTEAQASGSDLSDLFGGESPDDLFRRFFGDPEGSAPPRPQTVRAAGTGFIISRDGFILTNNHVVEGATKIVVRLFGEGGEDPGYEARLIGGDPLTDSALIQLVEQPDVPLPEATFGDSSLMQPGDWVVAIGNPFNLAHTISVGVISAVGRPFRVMRGRDQDMLQTDAAINPGNSGGPLLNVRGEVVGMNTAIYASQSLMGNSGNIGIGFAVPINTVRELLPELREGKVTRGRIGVEIENVKQDELQDFGLTARRGAVVHRVDNAGPAGRAGVEPGDVILTFNNEAVESRDDLVDMVVATKPGSTVPMTVMRNREELTLRITVDELNLEEENTQQAQAARPNQSEGFGMTLSNLTPDVARRLGIPREVEGALVTDVDPDGPAGQALTAGDVILQVNRQPVANAAEASQALQAIPTGRSAQLLVWRPSLNDEVFVTIRKQ